MTTYFAVRIGLRNWWPPVDARGMGRGALNRVGREGRRAPQAVAPSDREVPRIDKVLDDKLSKRAIELDPKGYFIIKVDRLSGEIVAEHYTNTIDERG